MYDKYYSEYKDEDIVIRCMQKETTMTKRKVEKFWEGGEVWETVMWVL